MAVAERVQLGSTGLHVSRVCLGTMTFGGQSSEAESARILERCLERGVNFIDTANVYNGGKSEEIVGRLLKDVVSRWCWPVRWPGGWGMVRRNQGCLGAP
jgi:aryl-alcohol dehydrogenase-like predicted oxidoreductase